jgi:hypothetical protein
MGGLGGLPVGNMMQALGRSFMTSDARTPFANYGANMDAIEGRNAQAAAEAEKRAATIQLLRNNTNLSDDDIVAYSADPKVVDHVLTLEQQRRAEQQAQEARQASFAAQSDIFGGGSQGQPQQGGGGRYPLATDMNAESLNYTGAEGDAPEGMPAPVEPVEPPLDRRGFPLVNPELEQLNQRYQNLVNGIRDPRLDDAGRKNIEREIDRVKNLIGQIDPTGKMTEYQLDQTQRQAQGLPVQSFEEYRTTERDPALESRIQRMEEVVPRADAIRIATGIYETTRDPISGVAQVIDKSTGQLVFDGRTAERLAETMESTDDARSGMPGDTDFSLATGVGGKARSIGNTIFDLFSANLPNPEAERASQSLQNLQVRTQIALAEDVAGRPSNYLLQRFDKLAVSPNEITMGPNRARERFAQTLSLLYARDEDLDGVLKNPSNFQPAQVAAARLDKTRINRLIKDYESVLESFGSGANRGGPAVAAPPEAIHELRSDPSEETKREFDAIFGEGAADRALGGQ